MVKKTEQDPFLAREAEKYETPIPSREFILAILEKWKEPVKRGALAKHFALDSEELQEALRRRLKAMVRDGQLLKTPQGYIPITEQETCEGVIVMEREGEGFLRTDKDRNILLSGFGLRGYYHGDRVEVQIIQIDHEGQARGRIIQLIKAVTPMVIGRFVKAFQDFEVLPFDRKFTQTISVSHAKKGMAQNGDIVQVKILRDEKPPFSGMPKAEVLEVLGDFSTPGIEVNIASKKFNLPNEWPIEALKEAEKWGNEVKQNAKDDREDLTDLDFVTIDGEDAKDFDDAVYCESTSQKGWRLWVAIADVSYYVKPNGALNREAIRRGNSTYFPGHVIPMLPENLSNGLCSLKPMVPRFALVCQMNMNAKGVITRSRFYRACIFSKARLTYTEVGQIIQGNKVLREQYKALLPSLEALHTLYQALHHQRQLRGAIDFDTVETRILFDKGGKIKSIVPQVRNVAHKMIEESMLAANVCAAKFLERHKKNTLFRVHERPPQEKLVALRQFLSELGLDLPGRMSPTAKDFSALIHHIKDREDKHVIETVMLRSLSQAQYSPKNAGHFGLSYLSYVHFTSPIRRYPDLIVHRGIIEVLEGEKSKKREMGLSELEKLGTSCSESERRSDEATRDATLALKCHYMQDKVGQQYQGVISGVASFGIFVELKDIYIEGLVHVTALGNEYFYYDPAHHRMVGEHTKTLYRLGDSVEVLVARVDVEAKKIDLELVGVPQKNKQPRNASSHKKHRSHSQKRQRRER